MFDAAMTVLLVFVAASVGESTHFENEFVENMVHGLGVFAALLMIVVGIAALVGSLRNKENKKE